MGLMADILNERKLVVKIGREEARMKQEARSNRMERATNLKATQTLSAECTIKPSFFAKSS